MSNNIFKILVVDDEMHNYKLISEILSGYNVNMLYASCGSEAIEQCMKNSDISLIFMDIRMKGLNGFEVAAQIKTFRKNVPIVFQTAYAKDFLKDEFMISLSNGYLEKPIRKDTLINEVKKYLKIVNENIIVYKPKPGFSLQYIYKFLF